MATTCPFDRSFSLEQIKVAPNDIEIRIWNLPGLFISKTKCWVFERKDGEWKGITFIDPDFNGKIIKKRLDTPSTDWFKWDLYVNRDITPTNIREAQFDHAPQNDGMDVIVEVKFGNDYANKYLIDGDVLLTNLFKMIKSEFFNNDQDTWSKN